MFWRYTASAVSDHSLFYASEQNRRLIFAFLDLHDVSWGTKGSDKAEILASVQTNKVKDSDDTIVEVEEQTQASIDERFKQSECRSGCFSIV